MSNNILRLVGRAIYLIVFCQSFTLSAVAAGRPNITGIWKLNHLESDKPDQDVQEIVGSRGGLTDSVADQRETARGMPYDRILLMMGGISSPPENPTIALNDSNITLSDRGGARLTLHTDGRVENFPGGIQIITRWVNDTFIMATASLQASTKTTFARDGRRMLVVSEADFTGVEPVVARYLYNYESDVRTYSSSFWQLHPPVYHKDSKQIEKAVETSNALLDQINKEIAKAPIPGGGTVDSLMLGMAGPALAQDNGVQQPSARQQLQHIHTPQSIDQELARLTKDLELTPEQQQQVRPLLEEHHDRIQALLDKNPTASRQELDPQIHAISDETHRKIHALLTDHQKELKTAMRQREHKGGENRRSAPPAAASPEPSSFSAS